MGFIDLFVERDKKPSKEVKKDTVADRKPTSTGAATAMSPGYATTTPIKEFVDHFRNILREENEKNFPGNDFYEFFVMKNNMSSLPEQQAYTVAFSGLSAAGLTKEKLTSTAQKYLSLVQNEIDEFTASYDSLYAQNVTKLEETVKAKTQEMNDLALKINQLNAEIAEYKEDIMHNTQKLVDKKNSFLMAGNNQKAEIEQEITKINQYIL
jgi:hypothetical protein